MFDRSTPLNPPEPAHRSDTALLYVFLIVQAAVLVLSLTGIDPGFWSGTTLAKLYQHPSINAVLAAAIVAGLIRLELGSVETRPAQALALAGFMWGIGAACAFAFDVGVFCAYLLSAWHLYRRNAGAVSVARVEPTR